MQSVVPFLLHMCVEIAVSVRAFSENEKESLKN
jgi:hypothetical protein